MKKNGWRKQLWNLTFNKESSAFLHGSEASVGSVPDGGEARSLLQECRSTANTEVGVAYGKIKMIPSYEAVTDKNFSREGWPLDTVMRGNLAIVFVYIG